MPPRGKSNPRKQYFDSIKSQKLETLRWCLRHGGISVKAEDEDGLTGIQIAVHGGYADSLECLIENVRKVGEPADLEEPDEDGKTPLMLACHAGKLECVRLLVLQGKVKLPGAKCEAGKTARMYAEARKHDKIVAFLDNPTAPPEEEEEEEEDAAEQEKRVFMASQKSAAQKSAAQQQEEVHRQRVEAAEALEKALASSAPPVWSEVEPILKETRRALSIRNKPALSTSAGPVDPAVWNCVCLFELRLEIADRALTSLPPQIARLHDLVTLSVPGNGLTSLPDEVGKLSKLKNLEASANILTALPKSLAELSALQVIDVSNNKIGSLAPLSQLTELVAVNAGSNALTELPLLWSALEHMQTLACPKNAIVVFPPGIGSLQMLVSIDLSENAIQQVPIEFGSLTVKKLQAVKLKGNPLADARIRRFVEEDSPSLVKDLLNHVRKNGYKGEAGGKKGGGGGGGGKKGKKGKGKAVVEEEEEDEDDASIADLLAQMAKGSDDEDDGKPVDVS